MFDDLPDDVTIQDVEKGTSHKGLPDGKYHVRLDGSRNVDANSGSTGVELVFVTLAGPHAGAEVKETIWNAKEDADDAKRATARNRLMLFGHRLGLLKQGAGGVLKKVEGLSDFGDVHGAEVVIEVKNEKNISKKDGKEYTNARVTFNGIFPVNDPKCKDVPKGKPTTAATKPASKTAPAKGGKKTLDPSEL